MPSTAADCTKYYYVVENDSCESIETAHDIIAAEVLWLKISAIIGHRQLTW
jgi:hypothetical protein